ncbi:MULTISPECIES: hypothetical protein [Serratia]|uniref:hypothetical protein n=1 Tax=Serratia TaxID=613 RepID=UPI000660AA41|nr:hypothetical protein [Serratia sp. 506_PEND]
MNALIKREVKALRNLGFNSIFYSNTSGECRFSPFIDCFVSGQLNVDVYSWEREVAGVGNDGKGWDMDECDAKRLIIPFIQTREGFRQAYRLARLCVQLPRSWRLH